MKKSIQIILGMVMISSCLLSGCSNQTSAAKVVEQRETLYQVSTIGSLLAGNYDGLQSIGTLKEHGDIGIGAFDELDGELVMIDGKVFKVKDTGKVEEMTDTTKAPFAEVTFFDKDISKELVKITNFDYLKQELDKVIEHKDSFYAFRIDGTFKHVKVRSVPKQKKPYPVLSEVTKNQPTFDYYETKGSLIGFWCPDYVGSINVPGYHLHFISGDRTKGGHLLDISFDKASAYADVINAFNMELPQSSVAGQITDVKGEIEKVEK